MVESLTAVPKLLVYANHSEPTLLVKSQIDNGQVAHPRQRRTCSRALSKVFLSLLRKRWLPLFVFQKMHLDVTLRLLSVLFYICGRSQSGDKAVPKAGGTELLVGPGAAPEIPCPSPWHLQPGLCTCD